MLVRTPSHLSGVHDLAPEDALGGDAEVGVGGDVDGALPAELEGDGGEVLGGGRVDDPAHRRTPRVQNVVEPLLQQLSRLRNASVDNLTIAFKSKNLYPYVKIGEQ